MNFKSDTERQACREKIKWGAVIVAIVLLAVAVAAAFAGCTTVMLGNARMMVPSSMAA